jgi:hypothetical protein
VLGGVRDCVRRIDENGEGVHGMITGEAVEGDVLGEKVRV